MKAKIILFIKKTFGGLNKDYLIRQYLFGSIFVIFIFGVLLTQEFKPQTIPVYIFAVILWFFYPYSRFVYESIVNYILGNNIIISSLRYLILFKYLTMALCFSLSIFIAPIGLTYLYFRSTKSQKYENNIE